MVLPYVVGVVTAPLLVRIAKPLIRGVVKTTIGAGFKVKKLAAEAGEELHGLVTEVSGEASGKVGAAAGAATDTAAKTVAKTASTVSAAGTAAKAKVDTAADLAAKASRVARGVRRDPT